MSNIISIFKHKAALEPLFLLYSDNFDGEVVTASSLKKLQSWMSAGDRATHQAVPIENSAAMELLDQRGDYILTLDDIINLDDNL